MFLEPLHGYPAGPGPDAKAVTTKGEDWLTAIVWLVGLLLPWAVIGWLAF